MGVEFTVEATHPDLGPVTLTVGVAFEDLPDDSADDWTSADDAAVAEARVEAAFPDLEDVAVTGQAV